MRMAGPLHACALVAALFGVLAGCSHQIENPGKVVPGSPSVEETRSAELRRHQFTDIPVPSGFNLVTRGNRSAAFEGGGVRYGGYQYWGPTKVPDVVDFYERTMPLQAYGWSQTALDRSSEGQVLKFTKNRQECTVNIHRDDGATVILVQVKGPV